MNVYSREHVCPHRAPAGSTCPARRGSLAPQHTPCEKEGQRSSSADDFTASLKISLWRSRRARSRAQRGVVARRAGGAQHGTTRHDTARPVPPRPPLGRALPLPPRARPLPATPPAPAPTAALRAPNSSGPFTAALRGEHRFLPLPARGGR